MKNPVTVSDLMKTNCSESRTQGETKIFARKRGVHTHLGPAHSQGGQSSRLSRKKKKTASRSKMKRLRDSEEGAPHMDVLMELVETLAATHEPACDVPRMMVKLYQVEKNDLFTFVKESSHARRLNKLDVFKDIEFCVQEDQFDIVPVLREGHLVLVG